MSELADARGFRARTSGPMVGVGLVALAAGLVPRDSASIIGEDGSFGVDHRRGCVAVPPSPPHKVRFNREWRPYAVR